MSDTCVVCSREITSNSYLRFDCSHRMHLQCGIERIQQYKTRCTKCEDDHNPDLGTDRSLTLSANTMNKIRKRQLSPAPPRTWFRRLSTLVNPIIPSRSCFLDYVHSHSSLQECRAAGFTPDDAVRESISWSTLQKTYKVKALIDFGFKWSHMVCMNIQAKDLKDFTWNQIEDLNIKYTDLLQTDMSIEDLASLKFTPHQLTHLGFGFDMLLNMGANVNNLKNFEWSLNDIKLYFQPTATQWMNAGFYDRQKVLQAGWEEQNIRKVIPKLNARSKGRSLRIQF